MIIPFKAWAPDQPDLGNSATIAYNCFPRAGDSYGPWSGVSPYSDALGARCQGAYSGKDNTGATANFAGDATKLYKLSATSWDDVSRTSGYITAADESWRFCQFGDRVIATNYGDEVQSFVLGAASAFSDLSATAPKARHCALIDPGFLMLGNTADPVDGAITNRLWWSHYGDPTGWSTAGSATAEANQSGFNDLPYGGAVMGLVGAVGGAAGLVVCETAVYRVDYAGPPSVFAFTCIERQRGTPAPNSLVNVGPFAAFLGQDGFYLNDGQQSRPIGAGKIDKTFYADLNQSYFDRVYGAIDPINKLIIWAYPSNSSPNGLCDKAMIYSWESDRWAQADLNCELIFRALSTSISLDNLTSVTGFSLDALPFSLDSRAWLGGAILLAVFDSSHKYASFNGTALQAVMETGEMTTDGQMIYVKGVRPIVDGGTPTVQIGYRNTPGGSLTYTTGTSAGASGLCPQHISARYARARMTIPAGSSWVHAIGVEPEFAQKGRR